MRVNGDGLIRIHIPACWREVLGESMLEFQSLNFFGFFLLMRLVEFNQDLADDNEHKEGCDQVEYEIANNDKFSNIISGSSSFIFSCIKDCVDKDCCTHNEANKFKENLLGKIGLALKGTFYEQINYHETIEDDDNESLSNRVLEHDGKDQTEYEISTGQKEEKELRGEGVIFEIFPINLTSFMVFCELPEQIIILSFQGLVCPQERCLMVKGEKHDQKEND